MNPQKIIVSATTNADGAATSYTSAPLTGELVNIIYTKSTFADGVDFTITGEDSGLTLWAEENVNASKTVAPRQATHSTAGVAALYAGSGTAVNAPLVLATERIKVVVAAGGDTKSGTFTFILK